MSKIFGIPTTTPINPNKVTSVVSAVTFTPQTLAPEQQARARENIGVDRAVLGAFVSFGLAPVLLDADGAVLCDENAILVNM